VRCNWASTDPGAWRFVSDRDRTFADANRYAPPAPPSIALTSHAGASFLADAMGAGAVA
jgi:hypothetical protein